ncbi:MAG: hypothetical protein INR73_25190 [Williamsia sp.]|nr:hypothetical protein [Williamsia sp.]
MLRRKYLAWLLVCSVTATACNSDYLPKPTGYFKIPFPKKEYQTFNRTGFPYTFEYPVYAQVTQNSSFFQDADNPYWINIDFPQFNGKIYVSYYRLGAPTKFKIKNGQGGYKDSVGLNSLEGLVKGSYDLTFKHTYKASSIDDSVFRTRGGIEGIYFRLGGNTATANQFLLTDSVRHFLRGALYFDATPNEDSLGIVNEFLRQDMRHLINTFQWRNN